MKRLQLIGVGIVFFFCSQALAALPFSFSNIYFFGDSLTDIGNKQVKEENYFFQSAPVTNQENGKSGELWSNILAESYNLPLAPSSEQGNDWAVAGEQTQDVIEQIKNYLATINEQSANQKNLYVIWAGSNDLVQHIFFSFSLFKWTQSTADQVIAAGTNNIASAITLLYQAGARNFLILGVPDISITPQTVNKRLLLTWYKHRDNVHNDCTAWNKKLADENGILSTLAKDFPDINIYYWDPNDVMYAAVQNPELFHFKDTLNGYANNEEMWYQHQDQDPYDYIFFNFIHPTTHAHSLLATYARKCAKLITPNGLAADVEPECDLKFELQ